MEFPSVVFGGRKNLDLNSSSATYFQVVEPLLQLLCPLPVLLCAPGACAPCTATPGFLALWLTVGLANGRHETEPGEGRSKMLSISFLAAAQPHSSSGSGYIPLGHNSDWYGYLFFPGSGAHGVQITRSLPLLF